MCTFIQKIGKYEIFNTHINNSTRQLRHAALYHNGLRVRTENWTFPPKIVTLFLLRGGNVGQCTIFTA